MKKNYVTHSITREDAKFEIGPGWYDILDKIYDYLDKLYNEEGIKIIVDQVKEKFGGLRFYYSYDLNTDYTNFDYDIVDMVIMAYEKLSYEICEDCGNVGSPRSVFGWYKTLCDNCYAETMSKR